MSDYQIRSFESGDEERVIAGYAACFESSQWRSSRAFSAPTREAARARWDWATGANPAGQRVWLALKGEEVVAHFATRPHRVLSDGEERIFGLVSDAWVHPDHASQGETGESDSLMVDTAGALLSATCGSEGDLMSYGWLMPDVWMPLSKSLRFEQVRVQTLLHLEVDARPPSSDRESSAWTVESVARFGSDVRDLYERCRGEWGVSTVRDESFLNWRFVDNPQADYERFTVRDEAGVLQGLAVCRASDWLDEPTALVVDWLVPDENAEVGLLLRSALEDFARRCGAPLVVATFPEWSAWFERWQDWGALVHGSDLLMASRKTFPRQETYWLKDNWWYQPADLDLV